MLDVFKEEHDILVKNGMSNLVWKRDDLVDLWEKIGVSKEFCMEMRRKIRAAGYGDPRYCSKNQMMNELYDRLKFLPEPERLRISREFVKILITWEDFTPKDEKHNIQEAERIALKLKEILRRQNENRMVHKVEKPEQDSYEQERKILYDEFLCCMGIEPVRRGRQLEKVFNKLLKISKIREVEPFKIVGEQIDGAFSFLNSEMYYITEIKWTKKQSNIDEISKLFYKLEGKLQPNRGLLISTSGYTEEILKSMNAGKPIKLILLDGVHIANILSGIYSFKQLIDFAVRKASTIGEVYPSHNIFS